MKVQACNPPVHEECGYNINMNPPLGIQYLGAILRQNHQVKIYDYEALVTSWQGVADNLKAEDPDVVLITGTTLSYLSMIKIAKIAKSQKRRVVIGGPMVTALPEQSLKETEADCAVVGEGELVVEEALKADGIIQGKRVQNLDDLPFPARDLLTPAVNSPFYVGNEPRIQSPETVMLWSRGCPHRCTFCSHPVFGRQPTRLRSPSLIADEIEILQKKWNIKSIFCYDDELTGMSPAHSAWVIKVCNEIVDRGLNISYLKCQGRCNKELVTEDLLDAMWAANFRFIMLGCESGSPKVLKAIKKGTTVEDIRYTVRKVKERGLLVFTFWMVGNQEETVEDVALTENLIRELKPFMDFKQVTIMQPLPGSEVWSLAQKHQQINIFDLDFRHWHQHTPVVETDWMTKQQIQDWQERLMKI